MTQGCAKRLNTSTGNNVTTKQLVRVDCKSKQSYLLEDKIPSHERGAAGRHQLVGFLVTKLETVDYTVSNANKSTLVCFGFAFAATEEVVVIADCTDMLTSVDGSFGNDKIRFCSDTLSTAFRSA